MQTSARTPALARRPRPAPRKRTDDERAIPSDARAVAPPAPATPAPARSVETPASVEFENLASTNMFETLGSLRALMPVARTAACAEPQFAPSEIYAVAEVAYHYLRSGGYELAAVLFEGLTSIAPKEAYFALALGLAADLLGDAAKAERWYRRAQELDPRDGRADVNLAELRLAAGARREAVALLKSGARKAAAQRDRALEDKALAMLALAGAIA